jgi:hypothetical protein
MNTNTWYFPNAELKAIWDHELCGQISDGAWENSTPYNHYKFWCDLETKVSPEGKWAFEAKEYKRPAKRSGYNFVKALVTEYDLSARMRAYVIATRKQFPLSDIGQADNLLSSWINPGAADPAYVRKLLASYAGEYWNKLLTELEAAGLEKLCAEMEVGLKEYTKEDLVKDLKEIKKGMKLVLNTYFPQS